MTDVCLYSRSGKCVAVVQVPPQYPPLPVIQWQTRYFVLDAVTKTYREGWLLTAPFQPRPRTKGSS